MKHKLPITEELDFQYLLELMRPLHSIPQFSCLPELFAIIDFDNFIDLCNYVGGETITIPTLEELSASLAALQWFYDVFIKHTKTVEDIPKQYAEMVGKIQKIYARNV